MDSDFWKKKKKKFRFVVLGDPRKISKKKFSQAHRENEEKKKKIEN